MSTVCGVLLKLASIKVQCLNCVLCFVQVSSTLEGLRSQGSGDESQDGGQEEDVNNPWKVLAKTAGWGTSNNWTAVAYVNNDESDSQVSVRCASFGDRMRASFDGSITKAFTLALDGLQRICSTIMISELLLTYFSPLH